MPLRENGKMCDFKDCEQYAELTCSEYDDMVFKIPYCYRRLTTQKEPDVPCNDGVMPYAEYDDEQLRFVANSGSSLVCAYLKEHSVFDAQSIKMHLAIANVAAAEELKRRAKA